MISTSDEINLVRVTKIWHQVVALVTVAFITVSALEPPAAWAAKLKSTALHATQKTHKARKTIDAPKYAHKTKLPILEGVLVERDDRSETMAPEGSIIEDTGSEYQFNPASTIKLGTALWALVKYGRAYTYTTQLYFDGTIDPDKHVFNGDIYVEGDDPTFRKEQAELILDALKQRGIHSVKGNLYVSKTFTMNFYSSGETASDELMQVLSPFVPAKGKNGKPHYVHSGIVFKGRKVGEHPATAALVETYHSLPLVELLKPMLCFSINPMAENIGNTLGGPKMLETFLQDYLHLDKDDIHLDSTSGLGKARIKTHAMMRILLALDDLLHGDLSAIMAVAGQDHGTLFNRFNKNDVGSVMAKTGTLADTDDGVSALAGETNTVKGRIWFVIFEQQGNVPNFHSRQADILARIQSEQGGPVSFNYTNKQHALAFEFSPKQHVRVAQVKP